MIVRTKLVIVFAIIVISFACKNSITKGSNIKRSPNYDTCGIIVEKFDYPADLNRLDTLNYICNDSFFCKRGSNNIIPYFNDKHYALYYSNRDIKLLYDKRNNYFFCFKLYSGNSSFESNEIHYIYILDENEMPIFEISNERDSNITEVFKFYYDNKYPDLYIKLLDIKQNKNIAEFTYNDILNLTKELKSGNYVETEKYYLLDYNNYFKTHPYWEK